MADHKRGPRSATERLRRLLVMVPFVMERGEVTVAELAARFQLGESEVISDLERIAMCGVPPYGPDDLVDLFVDEGVVYAGAARIFTRPFRLTAPEGFALLAAGRAGLELPGADADGPLARALDKLERALGEVDLDVTIGRPAFADAVQSAVNDGERIRVRYWSAARDEVTERVVDPQAVFTDRGNWYLLADDLGAGGERRFRIDRIESVVPTGEAAVRRDIVPPDSVEWFADDTVTTATLRLAPGAWWILGRYPTRAVTDLPDGGYEVVLPVSSERWLARLILRAGGDAVVVAPESWQDLGSDAARRVLARYERGGSNVPSTS